jgi:uncharacterized protein (DUF2252 family)
MARPTTRRAAELSALSSLIGQTQTLRPEERLAMGKALRERAPRSAHDGWVPAADRPDPIALLIKNGEGRMEQLLPIRYGRMGAGPFAFFRGAAAIMASDLAQSPSSGLNLVVCGDCHLLNFGGFATTERQLIFDINDFDEAAVGPWEWDVKRLAASFVIAGRSLSLKLEDSQEAALLAVQSYRLRMAEYAGMTVLQVWYDAMDLDEIIAGIQDKETKRYYTKKLKQGTDETAHEKEFAKLAFMHGERARIIDDPPLIFHEDGLEEEQNRALVAKALRSYRSSLPPERRLLIDRYQLQDVAMKVVGIGSVGIFCGIALLVSGNGDSLFLQYKQAGPSVVEPYTGIEPAMHHGRRVVTCQRLMQAAGDMFLGWYTGVGEHGRHYYVRQLRDAKITPVIQLMDARQLKAYAGLCGRALARAHARSGDPAVLTGYMGKSTAFERAVAAFGVAYADQNERDYTALLEAIRAGRVEARMDQ